MSFRAWRKFCQFLLSSYTRKLTVKWILYTVHHLPSSCGQQPLLWTLLIMAAKFLFWVMQEGNFSSVIQGYTQDLWNLLDKRLLKPKGIIVLGQFLDQFLFLLSFFSALLSMGMSTALLWPLNQIVVVTDVLLLDCMSSLYILDINPLTDMILAKIFSFIRLLFPLIDVSCFCFCCAEAF